MDPNKIKDLIDFSSLSLSPGDSTQSDYFNKA